MWARETQPVNRVLWSQSVEAEKKGKEGTYDEVELAHVAKEGVEGLDKVVDDLKRQELVVVLVDAEDEVEAGVATEDELEVVGPLDEVAEARRARRDGVGDVAQHACALLRREDVVVLGKAHLPLPVAQNHRLDLLPRTNKRKEPTMREKQPQYSGVGGKGASGLSPLPRPLFFRRCSKRNSAYLEDREEGRKEKKKKAKKERTESK